MGKDFKTFYENKRAEKNTCKAQPASCGCEQANGDTDRIYEELGKYSGKSENELMSELFNIVNKNKSEGTLNNSDFDSFAEQIAPYLSPEQSARLTGLIEQLKNG